MVVLYHMDILTFGYLGVDLFLVINGYLITKSIVRSCENKEFSYIKFLIKRIIRLWPLVLLAGIVSLCIGFFSMLPDDLENLGQSVVASNAFANNILSKITTGNYWDVGQRYKPLMHMWYLGIVVQFYAVYPLIAVITRKFPGNFKRKFLYALGVLTAISLGMYIFANDTSGRFYFLQYRFFEFTVGGLLSFSASENFKLSGKLHKIKKYFWVGVIALLGLFIPNAGYMPDMLRLLLVVLFSCISLMYASCNEATEKLNCILPYRLTAYVGKASFSIFIWHQIILAFYRYIFDSTPSLAQNIFILVTVAAVSALSYLFIEEKIAPKKFKGQLAVFVSCILLCIASTLAGGYLYLVAGVARDIPELDVYKNDIHRGMHAEYCDRVYKMDVDFADDDRIKVLVIGHSFGRDWVNVLLESEISDKLDISYIYSNNLSEKKIGRIASADYIFVLAENAAHGLYPDYLYDNMKDTAKLYGIGTKRYGYTNGNVYANRKSDRYFEQTVSYEAVADIYEAEKAYFNEGNYIDFIAPVLAGDGYVRAFTDEGKYISQDCRHLTQAGAHYYAEIIDLNGIFGFAE